MKRKAPFGSFKSNKPIKETAGGGFKKIVFGVGIIVILTIMIPLLYVPLNNYLIKNELPVKSESWNIKLYDPGSNTISEMTFEDYVCGIVAAEMSPASENEALKAQAVASRSYILNKLQSGRIGAKAVHKGADFCTDPNHCAAYVSIDSVKSGWEENSDEYVNKILSAVNETNGEYLKYGNSVAAAYTFELCGGRTENAKEIWGKSEPYLISVDSPEDLGSPELESILEFSRNEFYEKLKSKNDNIKLIEPVESMIEETQLSDGGSVLRIKIGGKWFKGSDICELFNLPSRNFAISSNGENIKFTVKGKGHGVGMSKYGADAMAKQGYNYIAILNRYYPGTEFVNLYEELN